MPQTILTEVREASKSSAVGGGEELTVIPTGPVIGAEVLGIDLKNPLDTATIAGLRQALLQHKVLFFRNQPITDAEQVRFSRYFGQVTPAHPIKNGLVEQPEVMENIKSLKALRQNILSDVEQQQLRANGRHFRSRGWHTDITFVANPTSISFLRGIEIPEFGGDTAWVDLEALYNSLSDTLRGFLDGLSAVHGRDDARIGFPLPPRRDGRYNGAFLAEHPLVRIHPETGRRSLFLSPGFIRYIPALRQGESDTLLSFLIEELAGRIDLQARFHWTPHSLAVWDNRATAHWGPVDDPYFSNERIVHRTTVDPDVAHGPGGFQSRQILGEPFYAHH